MEITKTILQEDKLEWQTPNLEIILTEQTEHGASTGNDGAGFSTLT